MIPKIIHYCWFSGEPLPKNAEECIASWKKFLPDYEIKKWTTEDFDMDSVPFVKDAYENKKWAYVTDYIRHYALCKFGGVYLDSDVLVLKDFSPLLDAGFVSAVEFHPGEEHIPYIKERTNEQGMRISKEIKVPGIGIQAAILATIPNHPLNRKCLDFYSTQSLSNVLENKYTAPTVISYNAEEYGFTYLDNEQNLSEGIHLYPSRIFANFNQVSSESFAVHCCYGSWVKKNLKQRIVDYLRLNSFSFIKKVFSIILSRKMDKIAKKMEIK